jgi:hypothetical protein
MGHERIGFLPKRELWNHIIDQLSHFTGNKEQISLIAETTLNNIKKQYYYMPDDDSVVKAMKYLVLLSFSAKSQNQLEVLRNNGIDINKISLFELAGNAKEYVVTEQGSLETNQIAQDALLETISKYETSKQGGQISLFSEQSKDIWSQIGSGSAFCELARGFIASFTDRYLRYYLEREAAHTINDYKLIRSFSDGLSEQVSHHVVEISKLMQSFAAGWFNKNAAKTIPDDQAIKGFLRHTFDKLREEFRREAEKK